MVVGPGRDVLVERTTYEVGETALLPADPDAALVTPPEIGVDLDRRRRSTRGREVFALEPGRHRVELRSADGDVRLDLSWVRPLAEQLAQWSADVLAGPRTSAGIVALEALPDALVLQAALGAGDVDDVDQAADALDRLTARLIDGASGEDGAATPDPLTVLYLLGEHGRTGDDDVLAVALDQEDLLLAAHGPPPPGLGLAVLRTVLAVGSAGGQERLAPLLHRAVQRLERLPVDDVDDQAAELELLLAVRPLLPDDHPAQRAGAHPRPRARCRPRWRPAGTAAHPAARRRERSPRRGAPDAARTGLGRSRSWSA